MSSWTRRNLGVAAGSIGLTLGFSIAHSRSKARVVVIGGGVGGATVAKYLAASGIDIVLVEPKRSYTTCFGSNLYIAGLRSFASLTHNYETLSDRYGIRVVHESAAMIDPMAKTVRLESGTSLDYDRLVASPGVAFDFHAIDGYDEAASQAMPHAWNAGPQTERLRAQLEAMEDGGVFVIAVPKSPFRCPPAPYERASLAAHYLKQSKPRSKIIILDAKDSFVQQDIFEAAWQQHYAGMIEWLPGEFTGGIRSVDVNARLIRTESDVFKADVGNIIPPQSANELLQRAGLTDQSGWCPIDPATFESKLHSAIHVLGDSAHAGDMPKSAFGANSQAKVCASAIAAALTGSERALSSLSTTCYSYLAPNDAVSNAMNFKAVDGTLKISDMVSSKLGASAELRAQAVREAEAWDAAFTLDVFG